MVVFVKIMIILISFLQIIIVLAVQVLPGHGEAGWPDNSGCCTPSLVLIRFLEFFIYQVIVITNMNIIVNMLSQVRWDKRLCFSSGQPTKGSFFMTNRQTQTSA